MVTKFVMLRDLMQKYNQCLLTSNELAKGPS